MIIYDYNGNMYLTKDNLYYGSDFEWHEIDFDNTTIAPPSSLLKPLFNGTEWTENATSEELAELQAEQNVTPITTMTNYEMTEYLADIDCRLTMQELGL